MLHQHDKKIIMHTNNKLKQNHSTNEENTIKKKENMTYTKYIQDFPLLTLN
jgi:hypothetical protein